MSMQHRQNLTLFFAVQLPGSMAGSLNVGSPSQRQSGFADTLRGSFSNNPWATGSGPLNPDLETLLQVG